MFGIAQQALRRAWQAAALRPRPGTIPWFPWHGGLAKHNAGKNSLFHNSSANADTHTHRFTNYFEKWSIKKKNR